MRPSFRTKLQTVANTLRKELPGHYYGGLSQDFIAKVLHGKNFPTRLIQNYQKWFSEPPSASLIHSWESSAYAMARLLKTANLLDVYITMEYSFPSERDPFAKPRRADFVLFGKDQLQQNNSVVIETKQWDLAEMCVSTQPDNIRIKTNGKFHEELHPSIQAETYAIDMVDVLEKHNAEQCFLVSGFAYLHNCRKLPPEKYAVLFDPKFDDVRETTPLYTARYRSALIRDLRWALGKRQGESVWEEFCELRTRKI